VIAALEAIVRARWNDLAPEQALPERLHFLKTSVEDWPPPSAPMLLFAFADAAKAPVAAFKVARDAAGEAAVEAEARGLAACERLPEDLRRVVPRGLETGDVNGCRFVLMTVRHGVMELHHTWPAKRVLRCTATIGAALGWADRLAGAAPSAPVGLAEWLGLESQDAVLAALRERGWSAAETSAFAPRLDALWSAIWPAGLGHGDFWSANILYTGERVSGVLDWGMSSARVPIFVDALGYLAAFAVHDLYADRELDAARLAAIEAMAPFAALRARFAARGVDARRGEVAWQATLLASALGDRGPWAAREKVARAYARLLRAEVGASLQA